MPKTPVPGRAGPELDEKLLDAILAGHHLPHDAPEPAHVVLEMLASLAGPADPGDLAAEPMVRLAFARAVSQPAPADRARRGPVRPAPAAAVGHRRARRRSSWRPIGLSARLSATLAAVLVMLGGAVAAYAGVLPGPIQTLAHRTIDAPAPHRVPRGASLCLAYEQADNGHDPRALADAFSRLAKVAGGASKVIPYCIMAGQPVAVTPRTGGQAGPSGPASTRPPGQGRHRAKGYNNGKATGHHKATNAKKQHERRRRGQANGRQAGKHGL